jgi:hypothetical protein
MNGAIKDCAEITGVDKKTIKKLIDFAYDREAGWVDDDPLTLEQGCKHADPVSKAFVKLLDVLNAYRRGGLEDELEPYFEAMRERGITVEIGEALNDANEEVDVLSDCVRSCKGYKKVIIDNADCMTGELAPVAEELNFAPKSKFSEIADFYAKMSDGKDVGDKLNDRVLENEMYGSALEALANGSLNE